MCQISNTCVKSQNLSWISNIFDKSQIFVSDFKYLSFISNICDKSQIVVVRSLWLVCLYSGSEDVSARFYTHVCLYYFSKLKSSSKLWNITDAFVQNSAVWFWTLAFLRFFSKPQKCSHCILHELRPEFSLVRLSSSDFF